MREIFGEDNWLHSHAGSYVQDILGIKQPSENVSFSQEVTVYLLILQCVCVEIMNSEVIIVNVYRND